ncbi:MAG: hypothetical protein U0531_01220 [Dehalococcoidia bacterium]
MACWSEQLLDYIEEQTDLDVVATIEHDTVAAAPHVRELHARRGGYRFEVVVGIEVTTRAGHLLALFVEEPVPSLKPLAQTLDAIHQQAGLAVIPHPLSPLTRSVGARSIEQVHRRREDGLWFDARAGKSQPGGTDDGGAGAAAERGAVRPGGAGWQ